MLRRNAGVFSVKTFLSTTVGAAASTMTFGGRNMAAVAAQLDEQNIATRFGSLGTFTKQHEETFFRDGIVCVPKFIPDGYADYLRDSFEKIVANEAAKRLADEELAARSSVVFEADATGANKAYLSDAYFLESGDKIRFFLEPGQSTVSVATLNKVGHALHTDKGPFQEYSSMRSFGGIARRLGLQHPSVVQSMYILKPPRVGTAVGAHQDSTWIHTTPLSCLAIWVALDDATINNSCLLALRGSHRTHMPLSAKAELIDGKSVLQGVLPDVPLNRMEPLECPKGSIVVFNGQCVHGSTANTSEFQRHAYVVHMVDDSAVWSENNWFGSHLARLAL